MIDVIFWLAAGGLIGWLTSVVMYTDGQQGLFLNVVMGLVGAAVGGWVLSPLLGVGTMSHDVLNVGALLVSLIAAIVMLALTNLFRRTPAN